MLGEAPVAPRLDQRVGRGERRDTFRRQDATIFTSVFASTVSPGYWKPAFSTRSRSSADSIR